MFVRPFTDAETGEVYRTETIDPDAQIVTVQRPGIADEQRSATPREIDEARQAETGDREQRQLVRLDGNFQALRASTITGTAQLTVANYGPVSQRDLREMARLVNDLRAQVIDQRAMILDLTRLVRGLAAE